MRRILLVAAVLGGCAQTGGSRHAIDSRQTPGWSADDEEFFLHGSMSAEFVPERVLQAFRATYPELFPGWYGLIEEASSPLPIGLSRRRVAYFGGQVSVGFNCASCHLSEYRGRDGATLRVVGAAGPFDVYSFSGAVVVSMLRTAEPANMERFLSKYLARPVTLTPEQKAIIAADPMGSKGMAPDALHDIAPADLEHGDVRALLRLFHNIRTALHLPEQLPPPVPTLPGPGRTDAFAVLSTALLGIPAKFDAPVKFGYPWNLSERTWVHWDGNNRSPLGRNVEAVLGLGAPFLGRGQLVDFALVERQTRLGESIRAPRYPWGIDRGAAARGEAHYKARCAACHDVPEDKRLFAVGEVGTDPNRARFFDARQAEATNAWLKKLAVPGYKPDPVVYRSTGKYWANDMAAVWARSPYLHNGSVRTMRELLTKPPARPRKWRHGSRDYDERDMGFVNEGTFEFDTSLPANLNSGHDYGTDLTEEQKTDLIEYLKTR